MKNSDCTFILQPEGGKIDLQKNKEFISGLQDALLLSLLEDGTLSKRQFEIAGEKLRHNRK